MAELDLISVGIFTIVLGIALLFVGVLLQSKDKAKIEAGGIIFIGPFPVIGGATSERAFYVLLGISVVFMILFIILNYSR